MFSGCKSHSYSGPDDPTYRTASQMGIFEVLLTTTNRLERCDGSRTGHHQLNNSQLMIIVGGSGVLSWHPYPEMFGIFHHEDSNEGQGDLLDLGSLNWQ